VHYCYKSVSYYGSTTSLVTCERKAYYCVRMHMYSVVLSVYHYSVRLCVRLSLSLSLAWYGK
jgi:hypothetical protein